MKTLQRKALKDIKNEPALSSSPADSWKGQMGSSPADSWKTQMGSGLADSYKGQIGSGPPDSWKGPMSDGDGESLLQKQRARKGSVHFEEEVRSSGSQHSTNHTQPSAIRLPSPPKDHSTWKVSFFSDPTAEQKNEGPESSGVALAGTNKYFSTPVSSKGRSKKKLSPVMEVDTESNPAAECSEDKESLVDVARRDQSPPGADAALGDSVLQTPLYRSSFAMECQEIVKQIKGSDGDCRRSPGKRKAEELDVSAIDAEPPPYDSTPFKSLLAWEVSHMILSLENSPEISPESSPAHDGASLFGESLLDLERTDMQLQDFSLSNFDNKNGKGQSVDDSVGKWMENGVDGEWCIKRQKLAPPFDCKSINLSTADCSPACGTRQDVASPRGRILQIMEELGVCRITEEVKYKGANASHVLEGITSHCPAQVTEEERSKLCASTTQDTDVPANTTQDLPPQHFSVLNTTEVMEFSPQNVCNITQEIDPVSKEDGRANTTTEIKAVPPTATNVTQHSISFLHEVTAAASTTWVVEEEPSPTMVTASLNVGESIANTTQVMPGDTTQDIHPKHVGCIPDTTQDIEPKHEGCITDTTQDIEPKPEGCITDTTQDIEPKPEGCITDTTQDIEPKPEGCITDTTQDIEPKHGDYITDTMQDMDPKHKGCITDTTEDIEPKHGGCITDTTQDIDKKHEDCITDATQDMDPKHEGCITDTTQDIELKYEGCITNTTQDIEPKREGCITVTTQVIDMVPVYSPSTTCKILPVHESSKSANTTQVIILVPDCSESRPQNIIMVQDGGKDKEIGNTTENIAPMDAEDPTNPANKLLEVGDGGTEDIGFAREGTVDQKAFSSDTAQKDISATSGVLSNTGHGVGSALQSPEQVKDTKSPKDVPTFLPTCDVINEVRKLQGSPKDSGKVSGRSPSLEKEETTLHKADINIAQVEDQPPASDGTRPNTSEATPSTPDSQDRSRNKEGNDISGCVVIGSSSKDSGNISGHSLSPEMVLNKADDIHVQMPASDVIHASARHISPVGMSTQSKPEREDQSRNEGNDHVGCAILGSSSKDSGNISCHSLSLEFILNKTDNIHVQTLASEVTHASAAHISPVGLSTQSKPDMEDHSRNKEGNDLISCAMLGSSPKVIGNICGHSLSPAKEEMILNKDDPINAEDQPVSDVTHASAGHISPVGISTQRKPDSQDHSRNKGNDLTGCAMLGSSLKDIGNIFGHSLSPAKKGMIFNKDDPINAEDQPVSDVTHASAAHVSPVGLSTQSKPDSQDHSRNKEGNDLIGCAVSSSPNEAPPAKKLKGRLLASESYSMIQEEENVHDVSVFSAGSLSFVTSTPVPGFSNFQFQKSCKDSEPQDPNVSLCSVTEPPQKKDLAEDGVTALSKLKASMLGNEGQRAQSKGIPRPPTSAQVSGIPSARRSLALFNNPTGQNLAKDPTLSKIPPKGVPGRGSIRPPLGRQSLPRASLGKQTMEGKVGVTAPSKIGGSSFKTPKVVTTKPRTAALPFKLPGAPSLGAAPSQICQPIGGGLAGGQNVAAEDPPPAMYTAPPSGIKSFLPKPGGSSLQPPLPASSQRSLLKPKSSLPGRRSQVPALGSQKKPVPVKSEGLPVRKQLRPPSSVSAPKDGISRGAGKPNVPTTRTQPIKAEPSGESPDVADPASDRLEAETRCDLEACRCCQRWSRGYQSLLQENEDLRRRLGSVHPGSDG